MMTSSSSASLPSEFNSARQEIERINEIRNNIHRYMRSGKLKSANYEMDIWWTELAGDRNIKPKDDQEFYAFIEEFVKVKDKYAQLYQMLLRKEVFLAKLQTRLGKGSKYQKPDRSGMG